MKVLQIIDSLATGGAEKLILDSVPLYRKQAVDMDVLVLKDANYPFMKKLKENSSCKIFILGSGSVYNPAHIFKIAKILPQYDIAHVHLFPAQYWAVLAKKWSRANTKLIFTEHSTSNRRMRKLLSRPLERYFYFNFDRVVVISEEVRLALKRHIKIGETKLKYIQNGIFYSVIKNTQSFNRKNLNVLPNSWLMIQVSSFKFPKDQATLIQALQYLPKEIQLILVGDGPRRQRCEELVNQLKLEKRVQFLGNRSDVPQLLKTADVVILSSHYEGMSLSSIEGMASGKPFIASDVPGLREVVKDAGLLFPPKNEKALADHVMSLKDNPEYYKQVVASCQKRASQYDIQLMVKKYIRLYGEIIP